MGIPLTIFSLFRVDGGDEPPRHVLLRVRQSGYRNADASEYDAAFDEAEERRQVLLAAYVAAPRAALQLVGELQFHPPGDVLSDAPAGGEVELWVAQTRYGPPWVVLGTAPSEKAFWRAVGEDHDLAGMGGVRPARRIRALLLTDDELPLPDSTSATHP
jgi:hypothetical protein